MVFNECVCSFLHIQLPSGSHPWLEAQRSMDSADENWTHQLSSHNFSPFLLYSTTSHLSGWHHQLLSTLIQKTGSHPFLLHPHLKVLSILNFYYLSKLFSYLYILILDLYFYLLTVFFCFVSRVAFLIYIPNPIIILLNILHRPFLALERKSQVCSKAHRLNCLSVSLVLFLASFSSLNLAESVVSMHLLAL